VKYFSGFYGLPVNLFMIQKLDASLFMDKLQGKDTSLRLLKNKNGIEIAITNYGARIVSLVVPDKNNKPTDVVVGFDSLQGYLTSTETYHGAIVGRYANRIARGRFLLYGNEYQLSINNPPNHLHGGPKGFNNQVWTIKEASENGLKLHYFSPDGEENYPGNLTVYVFYTLTPDNELIINYEATTDEATVINITAHPFFNLNGIGSGTIEDHLLQVNASNYNPVDEALIPIGIYPTEDTPFDFRKAKRIGEDINQENEQLKFGAGYDHNFVLDGEGLRKVGKVTGDRSGINMEVITDQPGMQLYSGNYMQSENRIKYGLTDKYREAFCLETQHFPDSPNQPDFPTTILEPGEAFKSTTIYRFN
jgi:aldose 1-epimerase